MQRGAELFAAVVRGVATPGSSQDIANLYIGVPFGRGVGKEVGQEVRGDDTALQGCLKCHRHPSPTLA